MDKKYVTYRINTIEDCTTDDLKDEHAKAIVS